MPLYDARLPRSDQPVAHAFGLVDVMGAKLGAKAFPPASVVPFPRVVADADGRAWDYVLWCDTDTGELEYYPRDNDLFLLDEKTKQVRTAVVKAKPPLELVPVAEEIP